MKRKKILISMILVGLIIISPSSQVFAKSNSTSSYNLETPTLPNVGSLEKEELENNYTPPENMPDLNTNIKEIYSDALNGLEDKSTTNKENTQNAINSAKNGETLSIDSSTLKIDSTLSSKTAEDYFKESFSSSITSKPIATEWSNKGLVNKLSTEEFSNYLKNAENKYLPQINASKEAASTIKYTPINLSSKWSLMSYEQAKTLNSSLPSYNELKNNLQATATLKPVQSPVLSSNAEYEGIKNSVLNSNPSSILSNVSLPSGFKLNKNGTIQKTTSDPGLISAAQNIVTGLKRDVKTIKDSTSKKKDSEALDKLIENNKQRR